MKGFFGLFNKTLYMLTESQEMPVTAKDIGNNVSSERVNSCFKEKINISNVKDNVSTNKEMFLQALDKIDTEQITDIEYLSSRYRVSIDYQLYDNKENMVIDEAVVRKNITPFNAMLPLGLDPDTNELVYRVVKKIDHSIELVYREEVPYGIMKEKRSNLTLYINRVQVEQEKVVGGSLSVDEQATGVAILRTRRRPNYRTEYTFTDYYTTIYDSVAEGIQFPPVDISFTPRKIIIDLAMVLNNYFFTSDPNDILEPIRINYDEENPPVDGTVPGENEPVEEPIVDPNPDENTETPDDTTDTPSTDDNTDTPSTDENTGSTEEPSDEPSKDDSNAGTDSEIDPPSTTVKEGYMDSSSGIAYVKNDDGTFNSYSVSTLQLIQENIGSDEATSINEKIDDGSYTKIEITVPN